MTQQYNLKIFEEDEFFRSELLFFLMHINNYLQSAFMHAFKPNSHKKKLFDFIAPQNPNDKRLHFKYEQKGKNKDFLIKDILSAYRENQKNFDAFDKNFGDLLEQLPKPLMNRLEYSLSSNHAIFISPISLAKDWLPALRIKRNAMVHYPSKKDNGNKDIKVINAMGRLLHPDMLNKFIGCMNSAMVRMYKKGTISFKEKKQCEKTIQKIHEIFDACKQQRKEDTKELYSEKLSKKHQKIEAGLKDPKKIGKISKEEHRKYRRLKSLRKNWQKHKEYWTNKYEEMYPAGQMFRYNFQNFKNRYFFIGEKNIEAIEKRIKEAPNRIGNSGIVYDKGEEIDFARDIECLYQLGQNIAILIHRYIYNTQEQVEELTGKNNKEKAKELGYIRNQISHNALFWNIRKQNNSDIYTVEEIFKIIFSNINEEKAKELYAGIMNLLSKESYQYVRLKINKSDTKSAAYQPPIKIKKWTRARRAEYIENGKNKYIIDRRENIRRVVAQCIKAVESAYSNTKNQPYI